MLLVGDSSPSSLLGYRTDSAAVRGHFFELACHFPELEMTGIEGDHIGSRKPLLKRASLVVPLAYAPVMLNRTSWPAGFAPGRTPIVTYVRHDFELSRDELIEYLPTVGLGSVANSFRRRRGESDHHVDPPSSTYLVPFGDPNNRYASLVSTTGLHWGQVLSDGKQKAYATLRADLERWAQKAIELGRPGQVRLDCRDVLRVAA